MGVVVPIEVRLMAKVRLDENGCWIWTAHIDPQSGYGRIRVEGRTLYAHRVSYELHVGPIPAGLQLDHLCRVRECANPAHLEPVTVAENAYRSPLSNAEKAECSKGHALAGENLRISSEGRRLCVICYRKRTREAGRRFRARRRAVVLGDEQTTPL